MDEKVIDFNANQLRLIADGMENSYLRTGLTLEEYIERISLE